MKAKKKPCGKQGYHILKELLKLFNCDDHPSKEHSLIVVLRRLIFLFFENFLHRLVLLLHLEPDTFTLVIDPVQKVIVFTQL